MAIKRNISVLNQGVVADIDIVYGSDLVPIEFYITDYFLPENAITTIYCTTSKKELVKSVGTIENNIISFEPTAGFFTVGQNNLQIRITLDEKNLYSFEVKVNCKGNMASDDAKEVEKQPTLVTQLLTKIGNLFKAIVDEVTERKNADAAEESARKEADAREKAERQAEIAVERKRIDAFVTLPEGSTTGDAELMDARIDCEGKDWSNVGNHIRGITGKIIDACFDKENISHENYNLLKTSECTYQSKLQDDSAEIVSSTKQNVVTNFIPVEYGKYYTFSRELDGVRITYGASTNGRIGGRMNVQKADGSIIAGQEYTFNVGNHNDSTIYINLEDIVAIQIQINIGTSYDISTPELFKEQKFMMTSADSYEESVEKALNSEYLDGEEDIPDEVIYSLKHDDTKADKTTVEELAEKVDTTEQSVAANRRLINEGQKHDGNYIPNERFIRSISNLRDSTKAKEFEIFVTNNSGATIKNAAIVVGLHNTVGITPSHNNLPFQVYDEVFSEPTGFKFFDVDVELPYYIESESDCNYIVDKNIQIGQKTMAIFSDGKIATYNSAEGRMQISSDDGLTWTNICDNITSTPYRVLLPDSQDNLFVASNDGYRLYKYTSADGYKTGTQIIDMEVNDTKIGSILAEDSDGNLYLGTYQDAPWHCVIRKSTNHGDTWTIVFDTTECQHVHNIFINKKVTPNEIFIGLDGGAGGGSRSYVSTDAGATWTLVNVPYDNPDYAFRYAGENFYIGCGERNFFGGATLYKTTDYNDENAYYTLFDNAQGIRDITNVIEGSDDVLIAGGCFGQPVNAEQLFLSEDRGETWKTVFIRPWHKKQYMAGKGLRTFSHKGNQILSETSSTYPMRFVYGNGAKTILTVVSIGDVPIEGKTITLKSGYVANVEQMEKVLTSYEQIDGKVADICICDGYVVDAVSNKRVMTSETELCNNNIKLGQTSEYKILENHAYRLKGSVNLGKLSRLNFTKGFSISFLFCKDTFSDWWTNKKHVIFHVGDVKFILYQASLCLMHGTTNIYEKKIKLDEGYRHSVNDDYVRVTVCFTNDELPIAKIYTDNIWYNNDIVCTEYPIDENFSESDFVVGNSLGSDYAEIPNIAKIEIYNRVLSHGEIMSLTNGCNLITDGSTYN